MGANSKISWTDHTFNPWIGCAKVSPGCTNCYASVNTFVRAQRAHGLELWGVNGSRHVTSASNWKEPAKWNRVAAAAGERHRVFCASMADVFEDRQELVEPRAALFKMVGETPSLDWLLLSKRPENMTRLAADAWGAKWPANVWAGCTAENQERWNERLPFLVEVPAAVRFVSCEPLLGPISTGPFLREHVCDEWPNADVHGCVAHWMPGIDWVIAGAESWHHRRPMQEEWARSLRDQCIAASRPDGHSVAFFLKQYVDERGNKTELPLLDGRQWAQFPEAAA